MNLGGLVTIANAAPKNFIHCLCENGTYETNGGVAIPGAGRVNFAGLAREAGYRGVYEFSDLGEWDRALPSLLKEAGPIFVSLKVETGEEYPEDFRRLYSIQFREAFRRALQNS
jgi:phosphonopyruvate decarboxylase